MSFKMFMFFDPIIPYLRITQKNFQGMKTKIICIVTFITAFLRIEKETEPWQTTVKGFLWPLKLYFLKVGNLQSKVHVALPSWNGRLRQKDQAATEDWSCDVRVGSLSRLPTAGSWLPQPTAFSCSAGSHSWLTSCTVNSQRSHRLPPNSFLLNLARDVLSCLCQRTLTHLTNPLIRSSDSEK